VRNKQHLGDITMGIDEDSFLDAKGMLGPLPQRYRTAKWGVRESRKKNTESASVEQAEQEQSEQSGAGTECGSVDYAAAVGATGELPQAVKDYIESRLTALAAAKPQSSRTPRASGPNGKVMPWDTNPTWQEYKEHYATYDIPWPHQMPLQQSLPHSRTLPCTNEKVGQAVVRVYPWL
jgi:hypothetical protein